MSWLVIGVLWGAAASTPSSGTLVELAALRDKVAGKCAPRNEAPSSNLPLEAAAAGCGDHADGDGEDWLLERLLPLRSQPGDSEDDSAKSGRNESGEETTSFMQRTKGKNPGKGDRDRGRSGGRRTRHRSKSRTRSVRRERRGDSRDGPAPEPSASLRGDTRSLPSRMPFIEAPPWTDPRCTIRWTESRVRVCRRGKRAAGSERGARQTEELQNLENDTVELIPHPASRHAAVPSTGPERTRAPPHWPRASANDQQAAAFNRCGEDCSEMRRPTLTTGAKSGPSTIEQSFRCKKSSTTWTTARSWK